MKLEALTHARIRNSLNHYNLVLDLWKYIKTND